MSTNNDWIIKRLRVFIGGDLGEGAANLIESQAAQIAHLQMALADTEALEAGTSERFLKQAAQIGVMRAAINDVEVDAEECMGFDGFTAMLLPMDTYHAIVESAETHQSQALEQFAAKVRNEALEDAAKVADANCEDEPYGHARFRCAYIAAAIREMAKEMK